MRRTSPILPLDLVTGTIGSYEEDEIEKMIKQNLKMILLTNPGERIMIPDFGVGLPKYIFELETDDDIYDELIDIIREQVSIYLPVIEVNDIQAEPDPDQSYLKVMIDYTIDFLEIKDRLQLLLETY